MSIIDNIRDGIASWLLRGIMSDSLLKRSKDITTKREYRHGKQRDQIKSGPHFDDNVVLNLTGLVVSRSVSLLFGKGVTFNLDDEAAEEWLNACWEANKKNILLQNIATFGAEAGDCYITIRKDGIIGRDGVTYPRIVKVDPRFVEMITDPNDDERVVNYIITYETRENGKVVVHRQENILENEAWYVRDYELREGESIFKLIEDVKWEYDFAPILHWQNLPSPDSIYGTPDITDDVVNLQDKTNFVASNINKIIRLHAHPQLWGTGMGSMTTVDGGPGKIIALSGDTSKISSIEMSSDLSSSHQFLLTLRQTLFATTQTVDITSMADKIGALTNFGLRVLYMDALARLESKQRLYGDALIEINRRMLVMAGKGSDGGDVIWPDVLPANETEQVAKDTFELSNKLVSPETVSKARGYDWEEEQVKIAASQTSEDNVGAALLRAFSRGQQ